ncbi:MAG: hypothetical protein ACFE9L_20525 [Candidatus Hodarchaeota archaeon]
MIQFKKKLPSDKEIQMILIIVGALLTFFGCLLITPNVTLDFVIFSIDYTEVLNSMGWALLLIGFPIFLFGIAHPYLEAWRKSRLKE